MKSDGSFWQKPENFNQAKQKVELGKYGKSARQFISLGSESPVRHGALLRALKVTLEAPTFSTSPEGLAVPVTFVKNQTSPAMRDWATSAVMGIPSGWIHSDDGTYISPSGNVFNIDIKSCDSSHGPEAFAAFGLLFGTVFKDNFLAAMADIYRPIKITGKRMSINAWMFPLEPYLPSGHVFTTAINTFVLRVIFDTIISSGADSVDEIKAAGRSVGYLLSVETGVSEFLKHRALTPVDSLEVAHPVPFLGVYLRTYGTKKGDLPGIGPLKERIKAYSYGVARSFSAGFYTPEIDSHVARFKRAAVWDDLGPTLAGAPGSKSLRKKKAGLDAAERIGMDERKGKVYVATDGRPHIPITELVRPYLCDTVTLDTAVASLKTVLRPGYGRYYRDDFTDRVLLLDYGIPPGEDRYSDAYELEEAE
jgi:hypothetical protein